MNVTYLLWNYPFWVEYITCQSLVQFSPLTDKETEKNKNLTHSPWGGGESKPPDSQLHAPSSVAHI